MQSLHSRLNILFKDQKPCVTFVGWTYCFRKKTKLYYQKEKLSPLMEQCISQSKLSTTKAEEGNNDPAPKRAKILPYINNHVTLLLSVLIQHKINFLIIFQTFLQLTTRSLAINAMQSTVSNNVTKWILDSGPDSVVLSVKDLDENLTISSLENPLEAWYLLLSQRKDLLDNHLTRVPISPNQQGTFEMREEVHSSVGAQDTYTRGYELSDLEDIEFIWEDPAVDMDSVYRPGIDTPFPHPSLTTFR